jgi:hypothetical protein
MKFDDAQGTRISSHQACVVFDNKTGNIGLIHQSITFEGAEAPSKDQFEMRAKQLARELAAPSKEPSEPHAKELARDLSTESRGIQLDRLEVLHVQPDELTGKPMKVDTKSLRLVPIGKRAPGSKSKTAN